VGEDRDVSELDARALWALVNERHTDAQADHLWALHEVAWGLFRSPEAQLGVLGPPGSLDGADVVELGCGTAYVSAWLARAGARPVAVDLSEAQLATARRCQREHGLAFPLVEADGEQVPLRSSSFDLVVSEHGAAPWCDPALWVPEAARLLRPGGRLVFLTTSVLAGLTVPPEEGTATDHLQRSQVELEVVDWPGGAREHHPGHGRWIEHLVGAGFVVDALHELGAPPGAAAPDFYEIVTVDWARRWPAEDLWVAHRPG